MSSIEALAIARANFGGVFQAKKIAKTCTLCEKMCTFAFKK